jgi:hypothetical protein
MISNLKNNPTSMYNKKQEYVRSTIYGTYALRYTIRNFEETRDNKFLTLIDYIIDHWHTPLNIDQSPNNYNIRFDFDDIYLV